MMDPISQSQVGPEGIDFVLAYILGDVTDEQRHHFEELLASGDPDVNDSYHLALATFGDLPSVLNPKTPPPFVKEKVMQRVHEDAEQFVFDHAELAEGVVIAEPTSYRHPESALSRFLNLIPGYGNRASWIARPRFNPRRSFAFASLILGGFFASAYGYTAVSHILQKARQQEDAKVETVKHSKEFQKEYAVRSNAQLPSVSEHALTDLTLNTTSASLSEAGGVAPASENVGSQIGNVDAAKSDLAPKKLLPASPAIKAHTDKIGIDMNLVDAQFYFTNDPTAVHFTLRPVNTATEGFGKIYWNDSHADALFTVSDLKTTLADQRYVLYFTMDDGSMETVKTFQVMSMAQLSFFLPRAPGAHVTGAKLVLRSDINSGQPTTSTILTAVSRVQASN